jgi:hypothetical protein
VTATNINILFCDVNLYHLFEYNKGVRLLLDYRKIQTEELNDEEMMNERNYGAGARI